MGEKDRVVDLVKPIINLKLTRQDIEMLENVEPDIEHLLITSLELEKNAMFVECVESMEAVLDVTWEQLNTGHWSLVPDCQRTLYSAASLLKVVTLVQQAILSPHESTISCLEKAVKSADLGLLLGNSHRSQLSKAAHLLSQAVNNYQGTVEGPSPSSSIETSRLQVPREPVCELHCPSLETFSSQHFYPRLPVKITGCMNHWPALHRWTDLNYLLEVAGSRTVPVELGSSYTESDWSQKLMTLRQFVIQHVTGSEGSIGYLAQHQLFNQVPELQKDIAVPEYCACSDVKEEEEEVDINAWFGPGGTVSPLHYDPKHNLLSQVVGRKQVVLYPPSVSDCLYPHEGRLLSNTAQVDPEGPDYRVYPKYRDTQATFCLLSPGEILYIPPTWWHHVRALDLSFSVSFWWS